MDNYTIDHNLVEIGYYGKSIAIKINKVVSEIVKDLRKESGLNNVYIQINNCYLETDPTQRKKKIVLTYEEEILE